MSVLGSQALEPQAPQPNAHMAQAALAFGAPAPDVQWKETHVFRDANVNTEWEGLEAGLYKGPA